MLPLSFSIQSPNNNYNNNNPNLTIIITAIAYITEYSQTSNARADHIRIDTSVKP